MATEVQKVATGVLTNSILVRLYGFGILHGQVGANHGTQKLKVFQRVQERHAELRKILNNKEAWSLLCCSQKVLDGCIIFNLLGYKKKRALPKDPRVQSFVQIIAEKNRQTVPMA